jgi:hypothetical protein
VHDRRIDGKVHTFGNYGALYKRAMTWYDHETDSLWSQPIGTAMSGTYKGVRLEMIPTEVVPWGTWRREHPQTLVLDTFGRFTGFSADPFIGAVGENAYVLGAVLAESAKAFPFDEISETVVVNDAVGGIPVVVYANPDDRAAHIFVRSLGDRVLTFRWQNGRLTDNETDTVWDTATGLAVEGALRGELLQEVPYTTSYLWAWRDFFPRSEVYGE